MDRLINAALLTVAAYVWVFRKYGLLAMVTKRLAKHAAVGRAKWQIFWNVPVRDHKDLQLKASDLIARLRSERQQTSYVLAA